VTDTLGLMNEAVVKAKEASVDFVQFGGMTLKGGTQTEHFLEVVRRVDPDLVTRIEFLYPGNNWGNARSDYYDSINQAFDLIARRHKMPQRTPSYLYKDILDHNDLAVVILQNLDHFMRLQGRSSPYGYAAHSISQLKEPLSELRSRLRELKGVGKTTERIIREILDTRTSSYHESFF
jgi:hypothetical protein